MIGEVMDKIAFVMRARSLQELGEIESEVTFRKCFKDPSVIDALADRALSSAPKKSQDSSDCLKTWVKLNPSVLALASSAAPLVEPSAPPLSAVLIPSAPPLPMSSNREDLVVFPSAPLLSAQEKKDDSISLAGRKLTVTPRDPELISVIEQWMKTTRGAGTCANAIRKVALFANASNISGIFGPYGKGAAVLSAPLDCVEFVRAIRKCPKTALGRLEFIEKGLDMVGGVAVLAGLTQATGATTVGMIVGAIGSIPGIILASAKLKEAHELRKAAENESPMVRQALKTHLVCMSLKFAKSALNILLVIPVVWLLIAGAPLWPLAVLIGSIVSSVFQITEHFYKELAPCSVKIEELSKNDDFLLLEKSI